ncbi:HK97 family phage prohead protease [Microbulbifer halophilus]|uniref:HK97 family phage prohead protease n=1 Tax=Microbulbifer halophilus TaxID=453963 RepID=A0ABW5EC65_9GAMM|nr:HK97 family phage prohead protease [Microbulbifer halophilus]MCW8125768.1 HK97 family phage prohead protease [Microbulbifer halophilus]
MTVTLNQLARRVADLEMALRHKRMDLALDHVQKFVSGGRRVVTGIASTKQVDRMGDIVEPKGGHWSLPVPLLWMHRHDEPVGWVREATATDSGVRVRVEIAEGIPRADEVWKMLEAGLVDSFSIGFIGTKSKPIKTGRRFTEWELIEISVVSIPANPGAKIGKQYSRGEAVKLNTVGRGAVRLKRG